MKLKKYNNGGTVKLQNAGKVPEAVVTAYAPSINTKQGKIAAQNMAARLLSGQDNTGRVPSSYYNYVTGELNGAVPTRQAINNASKELLPYVLGTAFGPAGAIATMTGEAINTGVNAATKGNKDSWGDLFVNEEKHPIWNTVMDFTNPGYLLVGGQPKPSKASDTGVAILRGESAKRFLEDAAKVWGERIETKNLSDSPVVQNILAGKVGWAPRTTETLYHHSNTPLSELDPMFKSWDVVEHNAPRGKVWLTEDSGTAGFLAERPYHQTAEVTLTKPMVQVGESIGNGKNVVRNDIVRFAQDTGADGIQFKGIADNQLTNQNITASFKPEILNPVELNYETRAVFPDDVLTSEGRNAIMARFIEKHPELKIETVPTKTITRSDGRTFSVLGESEVPESVESVLTDIRTKLKNYKNPNKPIDEIVKEIQDKIKLTPEVARQTLYNSDNKMIGSLLLDDLPESTSKINAHGIAKGNELEHLIDLLENGIDRSRTFYTGPLGKTGENIGTAIGTPGGVAYRDGSFIIAARPGQTLADNGIGTVLINDFDKAGGFPVALQEALRSRYPNIDFIRYSSAPKYYQSLSSGKIKYVVPHENLETSIGGWFDPKTSMSYITADPYVEKVPIKHEIGSHGTDNAVKNLIYTGDALPKTSVKNQYSAFSKLAKNPKSRLWQELRATLKDLPKEDYESTEELIRDLRSVGSTYANDYADILERGTDKDFWFNYVRNLKKYAPAIIPITVGTAALTNK